MRSKRALIAFGFTAAGGFYGRTALSFGNRFEAAKLPEVKEQ
jgi:hypothetical protein